MQIRVFSTTQLVRLTLCGIAVFVLLSLSISPTAVLVPRDTAYSGATTSFGLELRLLISNSTNIITSFARVDGRSAPPNITTNHWTFRATNASNDSTTNTKLSLVLSSVNLTAKASEVLESDRKNSSSLLTVGGTNNERENGDSNTNRSSIRNLLGLREGASSTNTSTETATTATHVFTTTPIKSVPVTHSSTQGFILSVEYQQQLLGGFKGFYHLSKIAAVLNLSTVEPFVQGTSLEGVPSPNSGPGIQTLKLSHFYDLYHLRRAFQMCSGVNLATYESFLAKSSRQVVFVVFLSYLDNLSKFFNPAKNQRIVEIPGYTNGVIMSLGRLNSWAAHVFHKQRKRHKSARVKYKAFRKSRVLLVDARPLHPLSWDYLREVLERVVREQVQRYGSASVVVATWRDIQPPKMISSFFYSIPDFPYDNCPHMAAIPHAKSVMEATEWFLSSTIKSRPIIGVHIRAERLLIDFQGNVSHYMGCLRQLKDLVENGTLPRVPKKSVHLFHDLGKYGSQTCRNICKDGYEQFLSAIDDLGYRVTFFEPRKLGYVPLKKTLAAFVDREYLTRVDVLVTIGRGEYQQNIVDRFVQNAGGRRENLYRICHNHHPIPACYPDC